MEKVPEIKLSRIEKIQRDIERLELELEQLDFRASVSIKDESCRGFETGRGLQNARNVIIKDIETLRHELRREIERHDDGVLHTDVEIPRRITAEDTEAVLGSAARRVRR